MNTRCRSAGGAMPTYSMLIAALTSRFQVRPGARVSASGSDTVRSLDMQDGDMIDVFVEQTGGFVGFVKP